MPYKVFLVEDEISTREGIRDNLNWLSAGFNLCGEAPDGEIALPQIEKLQPDVLITDIKMPFMDGLQLCKVIREHMPWIKIIIISGYNDFQYAQSAIKLGVTEYLLKPFSVQDLQAVLAKAAIILDQEKSERVYLKKLRSQVEDNLFLLREKFLLRLVTGSESSISAIEQSQQLGLNILAPYYQVIIFEVKNQNSTMPVDYQTCLEVDKLVAGLVGTNTDVLLTKKSIEEVVLILKGDSLEQLEQEVAFWAGLIRAEVETKTACEIMLGAGTPQRRLGDLHRSFAEAQMKVKYFRGETETSDLKRLDHVAVRRYLESGQADSFDLFFDNSIRSLVQAALRSSLLKRYVVVDIGMAVSQFVSDLGGNPDETIPSITAEETDLEKLRTLEDVRSATRRLFSAALIFRDLQVGNDHAAILLQAKAYIAQHFSDANLSLNEVASQVNFSPNHFSAVFSAESGETFRDYLTRTRIDQAKKLLAMTKMKCSEVAFQCGYNDAHYFSMLFRKNCRMTPQQFRLSKRT